VLDEILIVVHYLDMSVPTRVEAHQEHYEAVAQLYDATFTRVEGLVTPHMNLYTEAGLPFLMFAGAELQFETGEGHDRLDIGLGIDLRAEPDRLSSFHLVLHSESGAISSLLFSAIKEYDPGNYRKYKGAELIRDADFVTDALAHERTRLMGLKLKAIRAGDPTLAVVQGITT